MTFIDFIKKHKSDLKFLIFLFISTSIFGIVNRPIGTIHNLYCIIDDMIPVVPVFAVIYHSWYPLMLTNLIMLLKNDRALYYRNLVAYIFGQIIAYIIIVLYQTDVTRATNLGNDIFSKIIAFTYSIDNHYAGFPSIHVTLATIAIWVTWNSRYSRTWKVVLTIWSVLIIASTLLIKQHVFWDVPGGIATGTLAYFAAPCILKKLK